MKIFLPFTDYFIYLCPLEIKNNTMMKYLQLIIVLLLFAACQQGKSPDSSPATTTPAPSADTTASAPAVEETQLQATADTLPAKAGVAGREVAATVQALTDGKLNFIVNSLDKKSALVGQTLKMIEEMSSAQTLAQISFSKSPFLNPNLQPSEIPGQLDPRSIIISERNSKV